MVLTDRGRPILQKAPEARLSYEAGCPEALRDSHAADRERLDSRAAAARGASIRPLSGLEERRGDLPVVDCDPIPQRLVREGDGDDGETVSRGEAGQTSGPTSRRIGKICTRRRPLLQGRRCTSSRRRRKCLSKANLGGQRWDYRNAQ